MIYPRDEPADDGGHDDIRERYGDTRLGPWDGDPDRDPWTGAWVNPDMPEPVYAPPAYPVDPDAGEPPF